MGTGIGHGEERAILAAQQAISSPLLQNSNIQGARGLLVNVTGDSSMTLHEVNDAASIINEEAGADGNVIFGAVIDTNLTDEFRVTVIATGFNQPPDHLPTAARTAMDSSQEQQQPFPPSLEKESLFGLKRRRAPKDGESMAVVDGEDEGEMIVFGDDLEVPAVLRSQASSRAGSQPSV
jgi:cell division protein FtsZ